MLIRLLFLGLLGSLCQLSAQGIPDSALQAAWQLSRSWQLPCVENLSRWELMNLRLIGESNQDIPAWQGSSLAQAESIWWRHATSLPSSTRDSLQQELGLLEHLFQMVQDYDQDLGRLFSRRAPLTEGDQAYGLAKLKALAVALEDANIVQERLRFLLQQATLRAHPFSHASAIGLAQQHFRQGMNQARNLLELVKTGRKPAAEAALAELNDWLRQAPLRRRNWRETLSTPAAAQEAAWLRWERQLSRLSSGVSAWLTGDYPPGARHIQVGWSRSYLWYNHEFVHRFGGAEASLVAELEALGALGSPWPDPGLYPAFRPLGVSESAKPVAEDPSAWIFVVDVSGSMQDPGRLPLFRRSLAAWAAQLPDHHRISLISFANSHRLLLNQVPAERLQEVWAISSQLTGQGETNVFPALAEAYALAQATDQPCRVVLVSDGGLNYDRALMGLVETQRYAGIGLDAVYMPGEDPRYEAALRRLVETGAGQLQALSPALPELSLTRGR